LDARLIGPEAPAEKPGLSLPHGTSGTISPYGINSGSLALRLCRVAQGSLDAAFAGGQSHDWDLAAANLIVQEADGNMTALSGDPISYNRREVTHGVLVAAGRDRHARIVEHFRNRAPP